MIDIVATSCIVMLALYYTIKHIYIIINNYSNTNTLKNNSTCNSGCHGCSSSQSSAITSQRKIIHINKLK